VPDLLFAEVVLQSKIAQFDVTFCGGKPVKPTPSSFMERAMGIEPVSEAWEDAGVVS
jgi:hypothetical protein